MPAGKRHITQVRRIRVRRKPSRLKLQSIAMRQAGFILPIPAERPYMMSSIHTPHGVCTGTAAMPADAAQALQPVMDCLQHALPGLPVQVGSVSSGAESIMTSDMPQPSVHELVAYLRHAHPEAGPHYWSAR